MKVALVQHGCGADAQASRAATESGLRAAAEQGAALAVLQELHGGPYFCQSEDISQFARAESIPGPTTEWIGNLASQLGLVIVASVFERRAPGVYHNTAVVLEMDGGIAGIYRKMHIPDDPGYYEKFYFTPGDLGFTPIDTSVGKLGVLVCWDQWFPEAARLMTLAGAELLVFPTAIGWDPEDDAEERERQREAWVTIQRAHAIANGIPVISCNRTGFEPAPGQNDGGIEFWGSSFIADARGEVLCQAGSAEAEVLVADIDGSRSEAVRQSWPFLRDRRIDAYAGLQQRYSE